MTMRCEARLVVLGASLISLLAAVPAAGQLPSDSVAVSAVVERYHRALREADSSAALSLLAEDALILEGGEIEEQPEYRRHHLPADIAFSRAVRSTRSPVRVSVRGDVAWAVAASRTQGEYRGKRIASIGAELMVLTRTAEGWKISAIHWSSRDGPQRSPKSGD